jgi:hypothetical protein
MTLNEKWYIREGNPKFPNSFSWVVHLEYCSSPTSGWVLSPTIGRSVDEAMWFCEDKAKRIVRVLNKQFDEMGGGGGFAAVSGKPRGN